MSLKMKYREWTKFILTIIFWLGKLFLHDWKSEKWMNNYVREFIENLFKPKKKYLSQPNNQI